MLHNKRSNDVDIRIELEGIQLRIKEYIKRHNDAIEAEIDDVVDEMLTPQAIEDSIRRSVRKHLQTAVDKKVRSLFGYGGHGKRAIDEAAEAVMRSRDEENQISSFVDLQRELAAQQTYVSVRALKRLARPHETAKDVIDQAIYYSSAVEVTQLKRVYLDDEPYYHIQYCN